MRAILLSIIISFTSLCHGQGSWTLRANLPDTGRQCMATFVIGSKAYVIAGTYLLGYSKQVWEYDAVTNIWTRKSDFPASARFGATGFAINNKGYVCCGSSSGISIGYSDLWEYDPATDIWTGKAPFPGGNRDAAVSFVVGGVAYVGAGRQVPTLIPLIDFWKYDPMTDVWTAVSSLPGLGRTFALAFVIGNKAYVGGGFKLGGAMASDLYEFDPLSGTWITKLSSGFTFAQAGSFVMGSKVYIATGYIISTVYSNGLWEYDPAVNTHYKIDSFPPGPRCNAIGFAIGAKGYIGFGVQGSLFPNDLYSYSTKVFPLSVNEAGTFTADMIYPNPSSGIFDLKHQKENAKVFIYDMLGHCVKQFDCEKGTSTKIDLSREQKGIYYVGLNSVNQSVVSKIVIE